MRLLALSLISACATPPAPALFDGPEGRDRAIQIALDGLSGNPDMTDDVLVQRVILDDLGMAHVRVQQEHQGVPVFEGQAIVHMGEDGAIRSITDHLAEDLSLDTRPAYGADEAIEAAVAETIGWAVLTADPVADLWVLRREGDHLAWRVKLQRIDGSADTTMPVVWVDAQDAQVLWVYEGLRTSATTGTGDGNYATGVSLNIYEDSGAYYLEDTTHNLGTYTFNHTYSSLYYIDDTDTDFAESWQTEGVDAHYAGSAALEYWASTYGLVGLDGVNGPGYVGSLTGSGDTISCLVNYGTNYSNAGWTGDYLLMGDGDGTTYGPFTSIDIIGHEMTHGVTENSANLTYANESGALDEALSDVFGAMIERSVDGENPNIWMMGEDMYTPSIAGDALRYMDDPTSDGISRDHYDDRYTGRSDNGGVHMNNGIGNLAFYLLSEGGDHPTYGGTPINGVGADAAAAIWFRAQQTYMTSGTTFSDARTGMLSSATDLYGAATVQYAAVQDAWAMVGVGSASGADTCHPGENGVFNQCSADCPCEEGGGDCDSDDECGSGLECGVNNGQTYDLPWYVDVCEPAGSCHPDSNGAYNYCSEDCPCDEGEGDCDSDEECASGLVCTTDVGASYGLVWYTDVCEAEASCHPGSNGVYNYCSADCPCDAGEGDCDSDDQCGAGLSCVENVGADYGMSWYVDVCE